MIIHRHEDETEGFRYHDGDLVVVSRESDRHCGRIGRLRLDESKDRKAGVSTLISFVYVYDIHTGRGIGKYPVWDLNPAASTYNECDEIIEMIDGKPVSEIFLNTL